MEIDYESQSVENKNYNTDNQLNSYIDFFNSLRPRLADTRNMLMGTDPNLGYIYLISNPMYVMNSSTYEIVRKISYPDELRLETPESILTFTYLGQNFLLLHNKHSIYIYPFYNKNNLSMYIEHRINFLSNDEHIVKIFNIENEVIYLCY